MANLFEREESMEEFDYVVVGGGTAGCILANRLSEDGKHTILVLEAGERDSGFWIPIPAGFGKLLVDPRYNWKFETEAEDNVYGRKIVVPRGKGLGGSTLINGMIFVRGQSRDFDLWAQQGATGWSFADVLPYFRKLESYGGGSDELRGRNGPLSVVEVSERSPLSEAFIAASVEAGFRRNADYNGADQDGFGYYQVNQRDGRRWSASHAYLRPALSRPNIAVRTGAHVLTVAVNQGRASSVSYRMRGSHRTVRARREVILAAGAVQTPHILELSGIGDPTILTEHGITVRHVLPGVGANYRDHFATRMNWRVKQRITLNEQSRGWRLGREVLRYFLFHKGILTLGTGLGFGFVKTRPELETPDVQYFFMHASYANAADRRLDREPGMTIGVTQLRPESVGSIHLKSPDPHVPPAIRPNFLATQEDCAALIEGMRIARRIVEQPAMDPYRSYEMNPGAEVSTDAQWLDFARRNGQTIYHAAGTCSMGRGPESVVDETLKVHGIDGLRIVDASIMPRMVSGNTQAAVMMIAEKGADLIKAAQSA